VFVPRVADLVLELGRRDRRAALLTADLVLELGRRDRRAALLTADLVTAAILDRLAMHAIRVNIAGPSFRQHVAKSRAERVPTT
jgi:hypothetical protein